MGSKLSKRIVSALILWFGWLGSSALSPALLAADEIRHRSRHLSISDLVTLREPTRLRISPDGKFVTYVVQHAELARNDYEAELFLTPTDARSPPERIAALPMAARFSAGQGVQFLLSADSLWAPDSQHVAFVRVHGSAFEIWSRNLEAGHDRLLATALPNVELVAWTPDSTRLVYSVQRDSPAAPESWIVADPAVLYAGERVSTGKAWAEKKSKESEPEYWQVGLEGGRPTRKALEEVQLLFPVRAQKYQYPKVAPLWNRSSHDETLSPDGKFVAFLTRFVKAETATSPPIYRGVALTLVPAVGETKPRHLFQSDELTINEPIAWSADSKDILLLERRPTSSRIYRVPRSGVTARAIYETADGLHDVAWDKAARRFVAVAERPRLPPEIVSIDLLTRRRILLHRPNAHIGEIELPVEPRYVSIRSRYGHEFGVRVTLPNHYRPGQRYPLVATTYVSSNAFQRGAVGDEYPIYSYAAHGFVVAALDNGLDVLAPSQTGNLEVSRIRQLSPLDALEQVILQLVEEGLVDRGRCGITGLSYGAEIVSFATLDSKLFSVAATSSGGTVWDPFSYVLLDDSWRKNGHLGLRGLPFPDVEGLKVWATVSPALNANRVQMPILLQPPESEALSVMHFYHSLKDARIPVEMYVYPKEGHVKTAPLSKHWVYQRNLDWFRFWLKGEEDSDPAKIDRYKRWRAMRDEWHSKQSSKTASNSRRKH